LFVGVEAIQDDSLIADDADLAIYLPGVDAVRIHVRSTSRLKVLHGTKSMSCAKSVLRGFTASSLENLQRVPSAVQIA
jgi:hypothetical protein